MPALAVGKAGARAQGESTGLAPGQLVLLRALVAMRVAGMVPLLIALYLRRETLDRPLLALLVVLGAGSFTTWSAMTLRYEPARLRGRRVVVVELVLAGLILAADGWILGWEHTFYPPALGAVWSLVAAMSAGATLGPWGGLAGGVAVALARLAGASAPEVQHDLIWYDAYLGDVPRLIPMLSLTALYAVAGFGTGYLTRLQQQADSEISAARARDEVARTLHDGVLQTLAIFQRRSSDPELARLARDTDRDLRSYLSGLRHDGPDGLHDALHTAAAAFGHRFDLTAEVMLDDPPEQHDDQTIQAIYGAVTEALTNVGKHAQARRVVLYAGHHPNGGLLVTIYDDGGGFDLATIPPDRGLARSIRDRLNAVGAAVEVRSAPQQGTEVRLWVP